MRYPPPGRGYPPPGRRPGPPPPPTFSWTPYIIFGFVLFMVLSAAPRLGFWPMMILLLVGIPLIKNVMAWASRYWAEHKNEWVNPGSASVPEEKRKNRTYRANSSYAQTAEKPKRQPEYTVGDDGELVEIDPSLAGAEADDLDSLLGDEKPARRQHSRDSFV